MSKRRISGSVGRDQYNIVGDDARLSVDNRTAGAPKGSLLIQVGIGLVVAVVAGFLLFVFGWN